MLTVTLCTAVMWTANRDALSRRSGAVSPTPSMAGSDSEMIDSTSPRRTLERDQARQDLYGNDVSAAVATYTYDGAGGLHEDHSPQTEVPHLKPPIS
jgi:hypothetical protein